VQGMYATFVKEVGTFLARQTSVPVGVFSEGVFIMFVCKSSVRWMRVGGGFV
jgi:hypothetical protein